MEKTSRSRTRRAVNRTLRVENANDRVAKFDTSVLCFIKKEKPSETRLVRFVQDEWLNKTKSYLPSTTAKKVAKRMLEINHATHYKTISISRSTRRRSRKQLGGSYGAPLTGAPLTPGDASLPILFKFPTDITTSAQFAASSPSAYYGTAQMRGCGVENSTMMPNPYIGSNEVPKTRRRARGRKQSGGSALTMPASVPMNQVAMTVNTAMGVKNPIMTTGNPVVPGFQNLYSPLRGELWAGAERINDQLPLVWKTSN